MLLDWKYNGCNVQWFLLLIEWKIKWVKLKSCYLGAPSLGAHNPYQSDMGMLLVLYSFYVVVFYDNKMTTIHQWQYVVSAIAINLGTAVFKDFWVES